MKSLWMKFLAVTFLAVALPSIVMAQAQPVTAAPAGDATVHLSRAQAGVFRDALRALAAQSHQAFVAEGVPLKPTLSEAEAADLVGSQPLEKAVEKVASAYDYDVQQQGGVYILKKRYTNPEDLPGVTLPECVSAIEDLQQVLEAFNPSLPSPRFGHTAPLIADLLPLLTHDQYQAMQEADPEKMLRVASLSAEQQAAMRRIALYFYVQQPVEELAYVFFQAKAVDRMVLRTKDDTGQAAFGYDNLNPGTAPGFVTFTVNEVAFPLPASTQSAPGVKFLAASDSADTLGSVIASLKLGNRLTVDPALQAKPITVVGSEAVTPKQIARAMAAVYGLRVKTKSNGDETITRTRYFIPGDVTTIAEDARQVLPEPVLRALHADEREKVRQADLTPEASGEMTPSQWFDAFQRTQNEASRLRPVPNLLQSAALRRLQAAMKSQMQKPGFSGRIPLSSLSESGRQAFAVSLISGLCNSVFTAFPQRVPDYISKFDQLYITGGPYQDQQGKARFSINLMTPPSDGSSAPQGAVGASNMEVEPTF